MLFKSRQPTAFAEKLRNWIWPRMGVMRSLRYHAHRLMRISATPHSIGLGLAVGVFMGFSPFVGFHMVTAAAISLPIGGNVVAAALGTLVCNVTCPAMLLADYKLGTSLLGHGVGAAASFKATVVGWLILGSLAAIPSYFAGRQAVVVMRRRRSEKIAARRKERAP